MNFSLIITKFTCLLIVITGIITIGKKEGRNKITTKLATIKQEYNARDMMSEAKFFEGYSRWDDEKRRYETWNEAVERVMNMHRKFYADKMSDELADLIGFSEDLYKQKMFLGAQRALQFGGDQLIKHQARLYNCVSGHADRAEFFGEYFYFLLCFAPETEIITNKGNKKISDIEIGDKVLTYNEKEKIYEFKSVYNVIENNTEDKNKLELEFENGHTVKCTEDHEFLTHNRGWVEARDLTENDDIVNIFDI